MKFITLYFRKWVSDDEMAKIAAIIGRFQIPHHGHVLSIKSLVEEYGRVHIIVPSYRRRSMVNPLTGREVKYLLSVALKEGGVDLNKVVVRLVRKPVKYKGNALDYTYAQLRRQIGEPFVVFTGNKNVHEFLSAKGADVEKLEMVMPSHGFVPGEEIRKRIAEEEQWEHFVANKVAYEIKRRGIHQRIIRLFQEGENSEHLK